MFVVGVGCVFLSWWVVGFMANDKGILQGDIVSINKFDEQYFLFYYN